MTDNRLEEIAERWAGTEKYPWETVPYDPLSIHSPVSGNLIARAWTVETAAAIAAAPEDIAYLLSVIDRQREEIERRDILRICPICQTNQLGAEQQICNACERENS